MRQGPLAGRYPAVAAMVLLALIPYLALSAALEPLTPIIGQRSAPAPDDGPRRGLGNAAYAVGTVLAVQFAQHLPQRRMMVVYAVFLVIGSHRHRRGAEHRHVYRRPHRPGPLHQPAADCRRAAAGARLSGHQTENDRGDHEHVHLRRGRPGPAIGGLQAQADAWRPLFWIVAGIAVAAFTLAILTFEDAPPADPTSPVDIPAIGLAAVGCVAAFFGSSMLATHAFLDPIAIVPLIGGLAVIVILIVYQATAPNPLLTIRSMLTSSIPVAGIVLALLAAAASVSATALTAETLASSTRRYTSACSTYPSSAGHS